MTRTVPSRGFARLRKATFALALGTTTIVAAGAAPAHADSPGSFCGAVVQGHDAWYRNCSNNVVYIADDVAYYLDLCARIQPWSTAHWSELFEIRRLYPCSP